MHQLLYFSKIILSHENQYFGTQLFFEKFSVSSILAPGPPLSA